MRTIAILAALLILARWCSAAECKLAWDAAPIAEQVTKYRVYLGITLLAEVETNAATVLLPDAPCEIAVVAINAAGTSPPASMRVICLTDQSSADLKAWLPLRTYHREFIPVPRFYRVQIQTP